MAGEEIIWTLPLIIGVLVLSIWTLIWKGIGLYKSARRKQTGWFIAMLILNTAGILPIIYLILNKGKRV